MNKQIIISLSLIAAVAAIAVGGTVAYFSDTETSTGNTFTAGSIDLKIDNHCYLNGDECACTGEPELCAWVSGPNQGKECTCTWGLKDLAGETFFNFSDLKPGDNGEDTVSLHVYNNDAWACVTLDKIVSSDEDCTEPELEDEEMCGQDGKGELAENLYFVFWVDNGDNLYEYPEEILMAGLASDLGSGPVTYTLADSEENNVGGADGYPLTGSQDYYIGKAWCFGELDIEELEDTGAMICDGKEVNNQSQSDSLTGDIIFYAEQARNNDSFICGGE